MRQSVFTQLFFLLILMGVTIFFPKAIFAHGFAGTINLLNDNYAPQNATIYKDEKILFVNNSSNKRLPQLSFKATPKKPAYTFSPDKPLNPGEKWLFKFSYIGPWQYKDKVNPHITGTITVVTGKGFSAGTLKQASSASQPIEWWQRVLSWITSLFLH